MSSTASNLPDCAGISPIPPDRSANMFYNIQAFNTTNPQLAYRYGSCGRNILLTPGTRQWDFSLLKNTRIRESHSLEFRLEGFNLPNHSNWNTPAVDARTAATFGRITTAKTMRQIQFSLKYIF